MNILLPMAGKGRRFAEAGYTKPKPFIDVAGKTMVQRALAPMPRRALLSVVAPVEWSTTQEALGRSCRWFDAADTEGAACSALLAVDEIDNDNPLLIANCDQIVEWDVDEFVRAGTTGHANGAVAVFDCPTRDSKWSYVSSMEGGWVHGIVEKPDDPPSTLATCGIYLWRKGSDFVKFAHEMIAADDRVNGEFYIAPVFNYAIRAGWNIKAYGVRRMLSMGTPDDLAETVAILEAEA